MIQEIMNYTEKVNKEIKAIIEPFQDKLLKVAADLVLESFKNGIDVGKQKKAGTDQKAEQSEQV